MVLIILESNKLISPNSPAEELPISSHTPRQPNENQPDQVFERVKWVSRILKIIYILYKYPMFFLYFI